MTYLTFMLVLILMEIVGLVLYILDDEFDVIDRFIEWSGKKYIEIEKKYGKESK